MKILSKKLLKGLKVCYIHHIEPFKHYSFKINCYADYVKTTHISSDYQKFYNNDIEHLHNIYCIIIITHIFYIVNSFLK